MEIKEKSTVNSQDLLQQLARRRAIYPDRFNDEVISREEVKQLLEVARFAPNHKLTEPWRFHVIMGESKNTMGDRVRTHIENHSDKPEKGTRMQEKFDQSQAVIVVSFQRDPRERLPEWEEMAATAMAVQNIWVYAGALGMGGYLSTGTPAINALTELLDLTSGERVLGMFFLGRHDLTPRQRPAKAVDDFTTWMI